MNSKTISANIAYINPEDRIIKVDCSVLACSLYFSRPASDYDSDFGVTIKKTDSGANAVTIYPYSGETIDGSTSVTLTSQNDYKTLAPVSGGWTVIDAYSGLTVTTTGTQTLTNKTLTSPKINEDAAITAISSEINKLDGVGASGSVLMVAEGNIAYTDDATALVTIPDGAKIYSISLIADQGFNGTAPNYSIGYSGFPAALINAVSLSNLSDSAGVLVETLEYVDGQTDPAEEWEYGVGSGVLIGTFAGGGSNTTGAGKVRIAYYI